MHCSLKSTLVGIKKSSDPTGIFVDFSTHVADIMLTLLLILVLLLLMIESEAQPSKRLVCYAAERNKHFILEVLQNKIGLLREKVQHSITKPSTPTIKILEIASGTGEHAALFATSIPDVIYQPTEPDVSMHNSIRSWNENNKNVLNPIGMELQSKLLINSILPIDFQSKNVDVIICINMIHISPYSCTDSLFCISEESLSKDGFLLTYGPYRVNGEMVESNVQFDVSLKNRNSEWGVRDLEEITETAKKYKMNLVESVPMPANNFCLIFQRDKK